MYADNVIFWLVYILGGFLLGSCMFSQILPKLILNMDTAAVSDDHNPGCTNVFIHCGPVMGLVCLSLDMLKGFLPVYLSIRIFDSSSLWFALVLAAPVLGHAIAPLNHFQGGKCIATAFGALLGLFPMSHIVLLLAGIYIVFSTVLKINPNCIRSIAVFGLFGLFSLIALIRRCQYSVALGCIIISMVAIWRHCRCMTAETARYLS